MRTGLVVLGLAGVVLALGLAGEARATVSPPVADANTLHLWHFDETSGNVADSGNGTAITLLNPSPSGLGATAYAGFGTAYDAVASIGGVAGTNDGTTTALYNNSNFMGADASFTYECYIRFNQITSLPYQGNGQAMIIGHDGNPGVPLGSRGWDLKQIAGNTIQFCPAIGNNYDDASQKLQFTIPTTGDNAWTSANDWFHLAVTFDGSSKLLSMYWTKLTATMTATDNLVASKTLTGNPTGDARFTVASGARQWTDNAGNGSARYIDGSIDEVRISNIARAANQMLNLGATWPDYLPGDFNKDGEVGPEDFGILKDNFGLDSLPFGAHESWTLGDANDDGEIGPEDFGMLKDNFGLDGGPTGTYPLANVPEPASLALLALAGLALRRKQR